jgi:hypothetical protein
MGALTKPPTFLCQRETCLCRSVFRCGGNEKFAKLLLGEDVTGGCKGQTTALALSNGITNLAGMKKFRFLNRNN